LDKNGGIIDTIVQRRGPDITSTPYKTADPDLANGYRTYIKTRYNKTKKRLQKRDLSDVYQTHYGILLAIWEEYYHRTFLANRYNGFEGSGKELSFCITDTSCLTFVREQTLEKGSRQASDQYELER
jgi:hypothetical protein